MKKHAIAAAALWAISVGAASAQDVKMSDAVKLWLTGNDEASIGALAEEAKAGVLGAQLVLGQVDRDTLPGGYSEFLLDLQGFGRADVLRAKTAEGSINWLLVLSDTDRAPLGDALFWYEAHVDPIESALKLQLQDEKVAAEYVLWVTLNNGRFDLVNSLPAESYGLSDAPFLNWIRAYFSNTNKAISLQGFLADPSPEKVAGLLALKRLERLLALQDHFSVGVNEMITVVKGQGNELPETVDLVTLNASLKKVAEVDPYLALVERMCAAEPDSAADYQCMIQTFEIIGGYKTLMGVRSPSENAVPAEVYITSDRAVTALSDLVRGRSAVYRGEIRSSRLSGIIAGDL